ncbi:hypothetical protein [Frondihabitans sp. PAMC 28766]|uniref:hypothetical protein n=1 Tax=Frondihabitans sp. PAMC 28766 TaxID=1795630 RepID=UPI0012FFAA68|nr:hypothetical protein [Frondihabitans sp. PAMC 28766]
MNDYAAEWPFWGSEGQCGDGDPALPSWLEADVRAWAEDFNQNYSYDSGWPTEGSARDHKRVAQRLIQQVERTIGPKGDTVELQYWETNRRKGL